MKKNSPRQPGFTLLEVIISFAIIMVLISGIYGLSIASVKNNKSGEIKQEAALYGQKIFEDFRSIDVAKTLTKNGSDYTLTFSNGLKLTGDSSLKTTNYDLGNGYKADIVVTRNDSGIGSGQIMEGTTSDYSYMVNFKKSNLQSASMSDETSNDAWDEVSVDPSKPTEVDVDVNSTSDNKMITVKIAGGSKSFSKSFGFIKDQEADDEKKEIRLTINCSKYNFIEDDKGFEVHVFNYDSVPLNLCLQKTNTIEGSAVSEAGAYRLYNNRSSNEAASEGNLYDITVDVKNTLEDTKEPIFTGEISQNIKMADNTN